MTGKQKVAYIGFCNVLPASSSTVVVSSGGKRGRTDVFETQNTTKALYKHSGGGCSTKIKQSEKAGTLLDKRSGNHGFKQEVNYKSSVKVNDKVQGCTTEFETQVKYKKVTTYNTPKKSSAAYNTPKKSSAAPKSTSGSKSINTPKRTAAAPKSTSGYKSTKYYEHHDYWY